LKAIAKTPVLPTPDFNSSSAQHTQVKTEYTWLGIRLHEPVGDEMSAFGLGFDDGGVLLTYVPDSISSKFGFRSGDLVQGVDGVRIKTIKQLNDRLSKMADKDTVHTFTVIRNQGQLKIKVKGAVPMAQSK
jgi:S1-C subfamily serine protease